MPSRWYIVNVTLRFLSTPAGLCEVVLENVTAGRVARPDNPDDCRCRLLVQPSSEAESRLYDSKVDLRQAPCGSRGGQSGARLEFDSQDEPI